MGEVRLARQRGERSLELHRQVRGPDHPCTLATASNLSLDRRAGNDPAAADELHADTIQRYDQTLGPEHPDSRLAINYGRIRTGHRADDGLNGRAACRGDLGRALRFASDRGRRAGVGQVPPLLVLPATLTGQLFGLRRYWIREPLR